VEKVLNLYDEETRFDELFALLTWGGDLLPIASKDGLMSAAKRLTVPLATVDDLTPLVEARVRELKSKGRMGVKFMADAIGAVNRPAARACFDRLRNTGKLDGLEAAPLRDHVRHLAADALGRANMIYACHSGILWNNWNDFYSVHPKNLIPLLQAYRHTHFDLWHAGIPWQRTVGVMGKTFPNLSLNLCWSHAISPRMSASLLDEWIDLMPVNKIIGFGGDNEVGRVEKTWGHLVMARQNIARALARRIGDGLMSEPEAVDLARAFLYDNPKRIYGLV
jgi:hypothetical protein